MWYLKTKYDLFKNVIEGYKVHSSIIGKGRAYTVYSIPFKMKPFILKRKGDKFLWEDIALED